MGEVIPELARQALTREVEAHERNGVPLFPRKEGADIVTLEIVNQLRDELP